MDNHFQQKLLSSLIKIKGEANITVTGIRMNPTLCEGDVITIRKYDDYEIGRILVFTYKNGELLVHRLLKKDDRYYCKGDNAFRLEDIEYHQILGQVVTANGNTVVSWPKWKADLSYQINREFYRCRYDVEKTKESNIYKFYEDLILKREGITMNYKKNDTMDYIKSDDTSLAVFDPESGDTHFFDETGIDILSCLEPPCDLKTLLERLCKIYDVRPNDIRGDVEEFLAETMAKKVVLIV